MPVEDLYPIVKRAYRTQISGLKHYEPKASESLFSVYGFSYIKKRGMHDPLNEEFRKAGKPIAPKLTDNETGEFDTVGGMSEYIFKNRFDSQFPVILFCLFLVATFLNVDASIAAKKLQEINLDNNPNIVSYAERRAFYSQSKNFTVGDFDINLDGKIDSQELVKLNDEIKAYTRQRLKDTFPGSNDFDEPTREDIPLNEALNVIEEELIVPPKPLTQAELDKREAEAAAEKKRDYKIEETKLFVRKEGKDITTWAGKISPDAASFTYEQDDITGIQRGRIAGAVGFLRKATIKPDRQPDNEVFLSAYAFGGSIELNQSFDSRGSSFESSNLKFRLGGDLIYDLPNDQTHSYSGWVRYETDTDFETQIFGLEGIFEPYSLDLSPARKLENGIVIASELSPTLETNYGNVIDDPNNNLPYDEFWNLGYGLRYELSFRKKGKLLASVSSDYEHYWNVLDRNQDSYNWTNQLNIPLSSNENASLLLQYIKSDNGLSNAQTDKFTAGFGFKY